MHGVALMVNVLLLLLILNDVRMVSECTRVYVCMCECVFRGGSAARSHSRIGIRLL